MIVASPGRPAEMILPCWRHGTDEVWATLVILQIVPQLCVQVMFRLAPVLRRLPRPPPLARLLRAHPVQRRQSDPATALTPVAAKLEWKATATSTAGKQSGYVCLIGSMLLGSRMEHPDPLHIASGVGLPLATRLPSLAPPPGIQTSSDSPVRYGMYCMSCIQVSHGTRGTGALPPRMAVTKGASLQQRASKHPSSCLSSPPPHLPPSSLNLWIPLHLPDLRRPSSKLHP